MHLVPQFDTSSANTTATLINGTTEFTIPSFGDSEPPRYVLISVDIDTPVFFKVGLVGVDAGTDPHGCISLSSGPIIINVAGATTIDFNAGGAGNAVVAPLANQ